MKSCRIDLPEDLSALTPARVSVPFERGNLTAPNQCVFRDRNGRVVLSQGRALVSWSDGSVKWAIYLLDVRSAEGPLTMTLEPALPTSMTPVSHSIVDDHHLIDTGKLLIRIPTEEDQSHLGPYYPYMIESISAKTNAGARRILRGSPEQGIRTTTDDGRLFTSSRVLETFGYVTPRVAERGRRRIHVHETGPVRALVYIEGITGHDTYATGLEYIVKLECYCDSTLLRFEVGWRHADDKIAHWLKDIRFVLPFEGQTRRVTYGLERGYQTVRLIPGTACRILQADEVTYLAHRLEQTGQATTIGYGTASGSVAPGWMQARFDDARVSVFMRDFQREYPNEIRVSEDRLELGLWPEDANERIAAMNVLPPHPDSVERPELRHRHTIYDSLIARPYWAFFDKDRQCLETVQGIQKGATFWLDLADDLSESQCHRRARDGSLEINQATIDHESLQVSSRYRDVFPPDRADSNTSPTAADRAAGWIRSNEPAFNILGKWDAGDLIYMHFSPGFPKDADEKHWKRRQHSRIDYWNNNEEEPLHGLFLHFLSTRDKASFDYAVNMARHFLDIDVQHYPFYGVHTHAAGHCFRGDDGSATDHFWCEGLIDFYLLTGDPSILEALGGIIEVCVETHKNRKFTDVDLRTISLYLMQMATYYELLEDPRLLERARQLGQELLDDQMPEGHFMNFGKTVRERARRDGPDNDATQSFHGFFNTLALEGLSRLYYIDQDEKWGTAFVRCFNLMREQDLFKDESVDGRSFSAPGVPSTQYGLEPLSNMIATAQLVMVCPLAYQLIQDTEILAMCRRMIDAIERGILGPEYGLGWAGLGMEGLIDAKDLTAYDADGNRIPATPENFAVQGRPLMPSVILRCIQPVLGWLEGLEGK